MRPPNFILIPIFFFFFFINQEEVQSFTGMAQSFLQGMGVTQLTIPPEVSNPVIQPVSKKKKHSIKINTSPSFNNSNHSQDNAPNMNFAILLFGNSNLFIVLQSIPYVGPIAGGIRPGTRLHVEGTVPHNAKQYANIYFLIFISFNGICTILVLWITFFFPMQVSNKLQNRGKRCWWCRFSFQSPVRTLRIHEQLQKWEMAEGGIGSW